MLRTDPSHAVINEKNAKYEYPLVDDGEGLR